MFISLHHYHTVLVCSRERVNYYCFIEEVMSYCIIAYSLVLTINVVELTIGYVSLLQRCPYREVSHYRVQRYVL